MKNQQFVIGLDYGTDSVRAVLLNAINGEELAHSVHYYERWKSLKYCNPNRNQFRQHPSDHIEGLERTIKSVLAISQIIPNQVKGITIDTTGSSPIPITRDGEALVFKKGFENNPNAMMILWKDHTAIEEADEINDLCKTWGGENYLKYSGGIYSSEWFWAKILHIARTDRSVTENAYTWMEHCDYMTFQLIEENDLETFKRSRCAAGHKAMWHQEWGGLPSEEFLLKLDPYLAKLRPNLYQETYTSDIKAGKLSKKWAKILGLSQETIVSVGTFDAHAGAVGAKIHEKSLIRVMGTSTCDIIVSGKDSYKSTPVNGICGQVDGSVLPGMVGLEAGQSAFGDVLAWFKNVLAWPIDNIVLQSLNIDEEQKNQLKAEFDQNLISKLTEAAQSIPPEDSIPVALDWINGRRTPDANQNLKGAIANINLGTTAAHLFLALIHSICFGSKSIVDRFLKEGVEINQVIGIGGVAKKSKFIMQTLANTLDMPVKVAESEQTPALGAAIYASIASGIYNSFDEASEALGSPYHDIYYPEPAQVEIMQDLMKKYTAFGIDIEQLTHVLNS
ncbi:MAG: ribulokinase [Flavobacteriaceae bacterium]|nr:ribulokinase [Flavobacteriaceae bacterium]